MVAAGLIGGGGALWLKLDIRSGVQAGDPALLLAAVNVRLLISLSRLARTAMIL